MVPVASPLLLLLPFLPSALFCIYLSLPFFAFSSTNLLEPLVKPVASYAAYSVRGCANIFPSASLQLGPLYFLAQWTYNTSLDLTSVSSNTILSATAPLVTLVASMAVLGEAITGRKCLAIAACIGGGLGCYLINCTVACATSAQICLHGVLGLYLLCICPHTIAYFGSC